MVAVVANVAAVAIVTSVAAVAIVTSLAVMAVMGTCCSAEEAFQDLVE